MVMRALRVYLVEYMRHS